MLRLDPRIKAVDLDEKLRGVILQTEVNDDPVTIAVRLNYLTIEFAEGPVVLWIPYEILVPAMAEISKRAGC